MDLIGVRVYVVCADPFVTGVVRASLRRAGAVPSFVTRLDDIPDIVRHDAVVVVFVDDSNQNALRTYIRARRRRRMALVVACADEIATKLPTSLCVLDAPMGWGIVDAIHDYLEDDRAQS